MTCDCWRDEPGGRGVLAGATEWKENRYYFKRRGDKQKKNIMLSFYWWPGDHPLQGSVDVGQERALFTPRASLNWRVLFHRSPLGEKYRKHQKRKTYRNRSHPRWNLA